MEGLKRRDWTSSEIREVREAYRTVYRQGLTLEEAIAELRDTAEADERVACFVASLKNGTRGLVR